MNKTSIEWTDFTANPLKFRAPDGRVVWACEKLSAGCANCYAEHLSTRYGGTRRAGDWNAGTMATLTPFLDEKELRAMLAYKPASGKRVFVGDMTDVFGSWVPDELLDRLFAVFALRQDVTFQVLTKRADRMRAYMSYRGPLNDSRERIVWERAAFDGKLVWDARGDRTHLYYNAKPEDVANRRQWPGWPLPNVWLGVSVEDQARADERIPQLLNTPAAVRFISAEPLLAPLDLTLRGDRIPDWDEDWRYNVLSGEEWAGARDDNPERSQHLDWVIVGGESGHGARPCATEWIAGIVRQCQAAGIPAFVKQLGAYVVSEDRTAPADHFSDPTSSKLLRAPNGECWAWRAGLRDRKGGDPSEWPADLRVRQFPTGGA